MSYPQAFLLEILIAFAAGSCLITYLRKRRRLREIEFQAGFVAPIGRALAEALAVFLEQGLVITFRHRDGCGLSLRYAEDRFIYGNASDAELSVPSVFATQRWKDDERREFFSRDEFVSWLSVQSSRSLSAGGGHQRLTRDRITKAIEFCLHNDTSKWSSYNG